jgi:hypothetical protein
LALAAILGGIAVFLGLELLEEPQTTLLDLLLGLGEMASVVMASVGTMLLISRSMNRENR